MRRIDHPRMFMIAALALSGATACNYSFHSSMSGSSSSSGSSGSEPPTTTTGSTASASSPSEPAGPQGTPPAGAPRPVDPEPDPNFIKLPGAPMPAGPAPKLTIVSPANGQELVGAKTKAPDDKFSSLDCLQDARTFGIKLAAQNWTVSPGGQGVLVVVDGVYATVTHDLSKPIMMAELDPYERVDNDATYAVLGPMYECGQHWIAVAPTAANGQMLPVTPTVSWFFNASKDFHTDNDNENDAAVRKLASLPVVNWPLMGEPYHGAGWRYSKGDDFIDAHRNGRVARDPERVVFEWALVRGADPEPCKLTISRQDINGFRYEREQIPKRGTVVLPPPYYGKGALIIDAEKCGGMSEYSARIWTKRPTAVKQFKWPVPGSAKAEDFWNSDEGQAAFARSSAAGQSGSSGKPSGGGGKCKSQCRLEAGQCRTSCKGAKCASDCNKVEQSCKSGC